MKARARGMIRIMGDELDLQYLELWSTRLGVQDLWTEVRESAGLL